MTVPGAGVAQERPSAAFTKFARQLAVRAIELRQRLQVSPGPSSLSPEFQPTHILGGARPVDRRAYTDTDAPHNSTDKARGVIKLSQPSTEVTCAPIGRYLVPL